MSGAAAVADRATQPAHPEEVAVAERSVSGESPGRGKTGGAARKKKSAARKTRARKEFSLEQQAWPSLGDAPTVSSSGSGAPAVAEPSKAGGKAKTPIVGWDKLDRYGIRADRGSAAGDGGEQTGAPRAAEGGSAAHSSGRGGRGAHGGKADGHAQGESQHGGHGRRGGHGRGHHVRDGQGGPRGDAGGMAVFYPPGVVYGGVPDVLAAVSFQLGYYFSKDNLVRDVYLKSLMDGQGYVPLASIMAFKRMQQLGATDQMVLEAVEGSEDVEVLLDDAERGPLVRSRNHWAEFLPLAVEEADGVVA